MVAGIGQRLAGFIYIQHVTGASAGTVSVDCQLSINCIDITAAVRVRSTRSTERIAADIDCIRTIATIDRSIGADITNIKHVTAPVAIQDGITA